MEPVFVDLHIHTSNDPEKPNLSYDIDLLKTKVELVSEGSPYLISLTDYYAPTIQLGNKLMRGGERYSADATWITQNSDGTTTEISLSIYDGFEQEFRLKYFYEGTTIYLSRIVRDEHGNYLSYENGGIYSTNHVVVSEDKYFELQGYK